MEGYREDARLLVDRPSLTLLPSPLISFHSFAIESNLVNIPGLADNFMYVSPGLVSPLDASSPLSRSFLPSLTPLLRHFF